MSDKGVSIIIPTFNTPEYLKECIQSIYNQQTNVDIDIIIGVDHCERTLKSIQDNKEFYKRCRVFYFEENVGTYSVKNNIVNEAKYEYIIFFDSDDTMLPTLVQSFYNLIRVVDVVRLKFQDFTILNGRMNRAKIEIACGVIGIRKSIFNKLNGYENWKCSADEEFLHRLTFNRAKSATLTTIIFNRRIHDRNLTIKADTNTKSKIRLEYQRIIAQRVKSKTWKNPEKIIKKYDEIQTS